MESEYPFRRVCGNPNFKISKSFYGLKIFEITGLTVAEWKAIMKKIIAISLFLFSLAAIYNLAAPYFEKTMVFASGFFIPDPGIYFSEPIGLLVLGLGILGLARLGRKRFLKP